MKSRFVMHLDFTQALKPQPWGFHKFHQYLLLKITSLLLWFSDYEVRFSVQKFLDKTMFFKHMQGVFSSRNG